MFAAAAALFIGAPAYSQYIFLDSNGDGVNSHTNPSLPDDILNPSITSADVYIVTDKNRNGSDAVCSSAEPFTINQYEFLLHSDPPGSIAFNSWTDNMGFTVGLALCGDGKVCKAGGDVWVALGSGTQLAPGKYKLGTLGITVAGTPALDFLTSSTLNANAQTAFGSNCDGANFDSLIRLGLDFSDSDGIGERIPVTATTWGKIKSRYR